MSYKNLIAYQKAFTLAMKIYDHQTISKRGVVWFSRSSKAFVKVCMFKFSRGYRKRKYEAHFVSKLTDADMENSETEVWLDFSLACKYISQAEYDEMYAEAGEVGRMLAFMIKHPSKFLLSNDKVAKQ